jgi:predicted cupin superfamily sugar epimerase
MRRHDPGPDRALPVIWQHHALPAAWPRRALLKEPQVTNATLWIERLQLRPHPEGGYFCETYRAAEMVAHAALPERFRGDRAFSTAIYFLLHQHDFSALHRLKQDELWHFYDGSSLTIHIIDRAGRYSCLHLGRDIADGAVPQAVVPAGCLFGATVDDPSSYALVGCTVAPGFAFDDFEMPTRSQLLELYPQHRHLIERLTRQ